MSMMRRELLFVKKFMYILYSFMAVYVELVEHMNKTRHRKIVVWQQHSMEVYRKRREKEKTKSYSAV